MQISDPLQGMKLTQKQVKTSEVRPDQIVNASIKQRISSNEAVIEIQGQEYNAVFENGLPKDPQAAVRITACNGNALQVRINPSNTGGNGQTTSMSLDSTVSQMLRDAGIKATPEIRTAVQQLITQHVPLNKDTLQSIQQIMQKGKGTFQQKLDVFMVMAQKNISITLKSYQAVFQVVHGPTIDHILAELTKNAPKSTNSSIQNLAELVRNIRINGNITRDQITKLQEAIENVIKGANSSPQLNKDIHSLTNNILKNLRMSLSYEALSQNTEVKAIIENSLDTLVKVFKLPVNENDVIPSESSITGNSLEEIPRYLRPVSETFHNLGIVVSLAQQEMATALDVYNNSKVDGGTNLRTPHEIVKDFATAIRHAFGEEVLPREDLRKVEHLLQRIEATVTQLPGPGSQSSQISSVEHGETERKLSDGIKALEQLLNQSGERIAALTSVQTADFQRVTQYISDHLREVGNEFKQTKKEMVNNVTRMSQFLEKQIPQASSYIQRIIEPTIEMMNRLVTKGEFAMFADMDFEHNVLRISGDLQQIKGLLDKGKNTEALQIFQRVRADLEKLNWQPSYTKVESVFSKMTGDGSMENPFQTLGRDWQQGMLSGRGVQEWMRGMGLNHERDAMEWMLQREGQQGMQFGNGQNGGSGMQGDGRPPENLKSMLLEGMDGAISARAKEFMEQALSNLTGQQLLSKLDPGNPVQSFYAQIPLPWEEGTKAVQVHVKSRTNGEQMDWENSSLYFLLDTPKYGETGIGITVLNREMAVRIQNDHPDVKKAFEPYLPRLEKELQGIGYRMNAVTFGPIPSSESDGSLSKNMPTIDTNDAKIKAIKPSAQEGVDFTI